MPRRKKTSAVEDIIEIGLKLPWWASLVLAAASYALFRHLAMATVPKPGSVGDLAETVVSQVIKTASEFAQYIVPALLGLGMLMSLLKKAKRRAMRQEFAGSTPSKKLEDLSWYEFEQLLFQLFEEMGYKVQDTARGADGGIDLRLSRGAERATVQCKHWKARKVPVQVIREQLGIVTAEGATLGIVVTSGAFTREARDFARGKPLTLIDGEQLRPLLRRATPRPGSPAVGLPIESPIAAAVDPACPVCNGPMALRTARRGKKSGSRFWGCERYPKCRGTRDIA